jgi:hypothetical protein
LWVYQYTTNEHLNSEGDAVIKFWQVVGVGVFAALTLDTIAAFASLGFGFAYAYAAAGSLVIYCALGYVAFRKWGLARAIGAALIVEVVDATLGWYIAWQIGPGALPPGQATPAILAVTLVIVFIFAAASAVLGATAARAMHGARAINE